MDTKITIDLGRVARETGLPITKVERTIQLLDDGNTVPFITRYRKDHTGGLDEEQIRRIQDLTVKLRMLADRKQTILKSIESQGKLTPQLAEEIREADSTKRLEDLYLPYKPKKQTLAETARQRGLEPLAREILDAAPSALDLDRRAADFISEDRKLKSVAEVLLGVGYLLAERFSERADLRGELRQIYQRTGVLVSTGVETAESKPAAGARTDTNETPRDATSKTADSVESGDEAPTEGGPGEETAADALSDFAATDAATQIPVGELDSDNIADAESISSAEPSADASSGVEPCGAVTDSEPTAIVSQAAECALDTALAADGVAPQIVPADTSYQADTSPPGGTSLLANAAADNLSAVEASAASPAPSPPVPNAPAPATRGPQPSGKSGKAGNPQAHRRLTKKELQRQRLESAFTDYVKFDEAISKIPPHRVLAINRGERARMLRVKVTGDLDQMLSKAEQLVIPADHPHRAFLQGCLRDSLQRLVLPSLEREIRREMTDFAEHHAVEVFVRNLRKLLLQPPVRGRRVLAVDPGFKSGCKVTALDEFGKVLAHDVIFVVGKEQRIKQGREKLAAIIRQWQLSVVAIGNGTASRDASQLIADVIANELQGLDVAFVIVNEAGASIYSTSTVGREEFPEFDAVARGAISIGRRLLDPLSELVKINPANIGVGLYQHDVKAKHLRESLDAVVESCVNYVGVDANTASPALLRYVSGLNQLTARRIYEYRQAHGPFRNREQFKDVPSFGESAFVQAAGFLKITGSDNPLDLTWIHPESYGLAARVLEKLGSSVAELGGVLQAQAQMTTANTKAPPATAPSPACDEPLASTGSVRATTTVTNHGDTAEAGASVALEATRAPDASTETDGPLAAFVSQTPAPALSAVELPSVEPTAIGPARAEPTSVDPVAADNVAAPGLIADSVSGATSVAAASPVTSTPALPTVDDQSVRSFLAQLAARAATVDVPGMARELSVGELLLKDILTALTRPGRDPREDLPPPVFRRGIMKLEDLRPGMELSGTVLNVVDFGAFVDIGLTDSGLVHISRLADRYVRDPHTVVSVGDILRLWVVGVDKERRRVSLTAIEPGTSRQAEPREKRPPSQQPRPAASRSAGPQPQSRPAGGGGGGRTRHDGGSGKRPVRPPKFSAPPRERKPKPAKPITKEMEEGSEPMRSFSDLLQFYSKKKDDEPEAR